MSESPQASCHAIEVAKPAIKSSNRLGTGFAIEQIVPETPQVVFQMLWYFWFLYAPVIILARLRWNIVFGSVIVFSFVVDHFCPPDANANKSTIQTRAVAIFGWIEFFVGGDQLELRTLNAELLAFGIGAAAECSRTRRGIFLPVRG